MRYAIFSDVHANAPALQAVLTDALDAGAERFFCLGDVMGYGPDPVAALECVHERVHVCLAGNHDDAVSGRGTADDFTELAARAVDHHRRALSASARHWLSTLPYVCEGPGFACAHGGFAHPEAFDYTLSIDDAEASWQVRGEPLLFVGHTHTPGYFERGTGTLQPPRDFVCEPGQRYVVNVGSVGYPRSGSCRSFYCLYDTDVQRVSFRSLPFDLDAYRQRINGAGMDEAPWLAQRARHAPRVRAAASFSSPASPAAHGTNARMSFPRRAWYGALAGVISASVLSFFAFAHLYRSAAVPAAKEGGPEKGLSPVAPLAQTDETPEPVFKDPVFSPGGDIPLSGGWVARVESSTTQKVRVAPYGTTRQLAFHLDNVSVGVIRLVRKRTFVTAPEALYTAVNVLSRASVPSSFSFATHLVFYDAAGRILEEVHGSGKRSAHKRHVPPQGTVAAEFRIDCRGGGVHVLAAPYFSENPTKKK